MNNRVKLMDACLFHVGEELVGDVGERLLPWVVPAGGGDQLVQIAVQEGGLQPELSPHHLPCLLVVRGQLLRMLLLRHPQQIHHALPDPVHAPLPLHAHSFHRRELKKSDHES